MAEISILIANFNNGHFFEDAYRSLLSQTSNKWEAVVIDDASTDNSVEVIQKLIGGDPRFRFYQNEKNLGYQHTLIRAIELSKAEIFGRLDPDDALYPEAVEISLEEHKNLPLVGMVYSDITICDKDLVAKSNYLTSQINDLDRKSFLLDGEIWGFVTFKKKFYFRTAGIDPSIIRAEDVDLFMKMSEVAPVKRVAKPLYRYRILNTSISQGQNRERAFFWHFVSLIKMAERRRINIEDLFGEHFVNRHQLDFFKEKRENLLSAVSQNRILAIISHLAGKKFN